LPPTSTDQQFVDVLRSLLEKWELPESWPDEVFAIIQSGVDGDAAACHCRTSQIEQTLREALQRAAHSRGVTVRTID
jgi:hypothetical protein